MLAHWIFLVAVAVYVAAAAYTDSRMHRIPNYLTVPAAVLALLYHGVVPLCHGIVPGLGTENSSLLYSLGWALVGFALGFGLLLIPWLFGGAGTGDVKLLAALGTWLGPSWLFASFVVTMLCASAIAIVHWSRTAAQRGISRANRDHRAKSAASGRERNRASKRIVPFAIPVALGTWAVLGWMVLRGFLVLTLAYVEN